MNFSLPGGKRSFWLIEIKKKCGPFISLDYLARKVSYLIHAPVSFPLQPQRHSKR